jgi:hypothetical protein
MCEEVAAAAAVVPVAVEEAVVLALAVGGWQGWRKLVARTRIMIPTGSALETRAGTGLN